MRQPRPQIRSRPIGAVHASWTTWLKTSWPRSLAAAMAAGAFLALVGALGSGELPLAQRLAYWVGLAALGTVVGTLISHLIARTGLSEDRPWLWGVLLVAALTPVFTVVVWLVTGLSFSDGLAWRRLPGFFPPALLVTVGMTALMMLLHRPAQAVTHAGGEHAAPPKFFDRLPLKLRGAELYAVEAEDHYLRLHTDRGQDLILMRLSDAVVELEGLEGARTHRSWWVAKAAVADAKRGDGRAVLTLKDGAKVPVSRPYAKALREAGWF